MRDRSAFDIYWAGREDESDIRALIGSVVMPGAVSVRFAREPDYFLGASIMGDRCDVLVARHRPDRRLAAIGCRAERPAFVNGRQGRVGYIGQIRVAEGFRGTWLVQQGAQRFREAGGRDLLYFGVIASENPRARKLLTGARLPGGVHIRRLCGITTYAIALRHQRQPRVQGIRIGAGSTERLGAIVDFLRRHGARRQLFPAYTEEDFFSRARLRGLSPQDIIVASRDGAICGVMAVWNQAAYKQDVVDSYSPTLRRIRPFYDVGARLLGFAPLTAPGQAIPLSFAACVCVANDDLEVMRALLRVSEEHARQSGKAFLMLGLADKDPLLAAASTMIHLTYRSDLYAAAWSPEPLKQLDDRVPYIEIATL